LGEKIGARLEFKKAIALGNSGNKKPAALKCSAAGFFSFRASYYYYAC
jgi:hypothetical protein